MNNRALGLKLNRNELSMLSVCAEQGPLCVRVWCTLRNLYKWVVAPTTNSVRPWLITNFLSRNRLNRLNIFRTLSFSPTMLWLDRYQSHLTLRSCYISLSFSKCLGLLKQNFRNMRSSREGLSVNELKVSRKLYHESPTNFKLLMIGKMKYNKVSLIVLSLNESNKVLLRSQNYVMFNEGGSVLPGFN